MTADEAFAAYEAVPGRLPPVTRRGACRAAGTLDDIADDFDVFLLDAFGVLNIGEQALPGSVKRVARLRQQGKRCIVVTNAAGQPHEVLMARYARMGYGFAPEDVVSSRATLLAALSKAPTRSWGLMATAGYGFEGTHGVSTECLQDDPEPYGRAEAFLLLGNAEWSETRQGLLEATLLDRPRPVWVANPDIVAPREHGFSIEPGHFAHRVADRTGIALHFFGKPFGNIYDLAFSRLGGTVDRSRILMVGDSLHTDILGAQTAGVASALIAGYGFFAGHDIGRWIALADIAPDYVLDRP